MPKGLSALTSFISCITELALAEAKNRLKKAAANFIIFQKSYEILRRTGRDSKRERSEQREK